MDLTWGDALSEKDPAELKGEADETVWHPFPESPPFFLHPGSCILHIQGHKPVARLPVDTLGIKSRVRGLLGTADFLSFFTGSGG